MQKTEFLELNLIEGSDAVDWAVLNENTEKLAAEAEEIRTTVTDMVANLGSGGSNARFAAGTYIGTGGVGSSSPNKLDLGFAPYLVIVSHAENGDLASSPFFFFRPMTMGGPISSMIITQWVTWSDTGISWYSSGTSAATQFNTKGTEYTYVAIGKSST